MQIKGAGSSAHQSRDQQEASVHWLTSFISDFLILLSQGQPPLDFNPVQGGCWLAEQIQAAEQSKTSMPGQGHAKCHFLPLSFLQEKS